MARPELFESVGVNLVDNVVLIDVRGGEFDILIANSLLNLLSAELMVQEQDFLRRGTGLSVLNDIKGRSARYFTVSKLRAGSRSRTFASLLADHRADVGHWPTCFGGRANSLTSRAAPRSMRREEGA
jgi:hypothetical protein